MDYSARDLFPGWYAIVAPQPSSEVIVARTKTIKRIITKEKKSEYWLDLVRLWLGVRPKSDANLQAFVGEFKKDDDNFPLLNNDNLVKVLASCSLCFKLETEDFELNNLISLSIRNAVFFEQYSYEQAIPVIEYSHSFLSDKKHRDSSSILELVEKELASYEQPAEEPAEGEEDSGDDDKRSHLAEQILRPIVKAYRNLSEESNVLWWLFGEYSGVSKNSFNEVGSTEMIISGAKELSDLTEYPRGILSARPILSKVLIISNGKGDLKKVSTFEVINDFPEAVKNELKLPDDLSELSPCLKALRVSLDHDAGDDWSGTFRKQCGGANIKTKVDPVELAVQFYNEFMFLKSFK